MKKYDKYDPSGVEWIKDIPKNWKTIKIKYSTYVKGRVGWNGLKSSEFLQAGYAYLITGTDFKNGLIDLENCYYIDQERYEVDPFIQLKENDLLITKDGTIGKTALVKGLDKPACLNSGIFVTRPLNNVYMTPFMYWILNSQEFKKFFDYTSRGSTILHLYQNVFEDFIFTYPNLKEQQQIAIYLDKKTTEIDEIIKDKEELIKLLEEEKEIIISDAVTKGLNPDVKMQDSMVEWIGDIPQHWEVRKLKYEIEIKNGYAFNSSNYTEIGKYPILRIGDINDHIDFEKCKKININLDEYNDFVIHNNDVLVALTGATIGKNTIYSYDKIALLNQRVAILRSNKLNQIFLKYFVNSYIFKKNIDYDCIGGAQENIGKENIGNFVIFIPFEKEQQQIVEYLDKETSKIDETIQTIKEEINLLKEYKEILIYEVVTGKIDVREEVIS